MNLREPEKQYVDDYEHRITNKIKACAEEPGFPQLADYGIDRQEFEGYLFDQQAIMDSPGTARGQLTVGGIITVLPVLVLSAFPDDSAVYAAGKMWATLAALLIGLLIALFLRALAQMVVSYRLRKMRDAKMEAYIKAVRFYEPAK